MLTLPHLLTTARRFVDGVCALQDVTKLTDAINGWTTQREEILRGSFLRLLKDLGYGHAASLRWLNDQAIESDYLPPKWHARADELEQQLSAARADLEALTGAVVEFRESIQSFADGLREDKPSAGHVDASDYAVGVLNMILRRDGITIPTSLAAWKAQRGGS